MKNTNQITIGSEKQIAWATKIRDSKIAELEENEKRTINGKALEYIYSKTDSRFWIDNRTLSLRSILENNIDELRAFFNK